MDPRIGVLCTGPEGPWCEEGTWSVLPLFEVPTDAELLKENVFLRYLASLRLGGDFDNEIIGVLAMPMRDPEQSHLIPRRPCILSAFNTVVAVRSGIWWSWGTCPFVNSCLGERELLEDGLNR